MRRFIAILAVFQFVANGVSADVPTVVTDIPPVHSLLAAVMGDLGAPTLLITGDDDHHHLQLRPSQARMLAGADLIFWIGPELTRWLPPAIETLANDAISTPLLAVRGTRTRPVSGDLSAADPHAWLDPVNIPIWLSAIARTLSDIDPENQGIYSENARRVATETGQLLSALEKVLIKAHDKKFVFAHDAYGYFTDRFDLSVAAVISDSDANAPGAARMKEVRNLLNSGSIACVFSERQQNQTLLRALAKDATVAVSLLDPVGFNLKPGPELYGNLMMNLATEMANCADG